MLLIPESEIGRFWNDMKQLAKQENVSLLGVSGAIAMQTVESIRNVSHGTLTGLFVAGKIINRNIFEISYLKIVDQVGGSASIGLWKNAYAEGNLGYLKSGTRALSPLTWPARAMMTCNHNQRPLCGPRVPALIVARV